MGARRGKLQALCLVLILALTPRRHLALSTNNIEKISSLSGMESLRILSLGRNLIKKIENLDAVADTLEELWVSYNQIVSLVSHSQGKRVQSMREAWAVDVGVWGGGA